MKDILNTVIDQLRKINITQNPTVHYLSIVPSEKQTTYVINENNEPIYTCHSLEDISSYLKIYMSWID